MKITIIGAGNIGGAIARGLVNANACSASQITVTAAHESSLEKFAEDGYVVSMDNAAAVNGADVVIFALKPWIVREVAESLRNSLDYGRQIIISVAAGVPSGEFLESLGVQEDKTPELVYAIPNIAVELGTGMTFIAPVGEFSQYALDVTRKIFEWLGEILVTDEEHLSAGTALSSCGLAYALRYMRAAAEGGVELGFNPADAVRIVSLTMAGAAALVRENNSHPEVEIDRVTTPGGITIKGLNAMEEAGFTNAVIQGLKASI